MTENSGDGDIRLHGPGDVELLICRSADAWFWCIHNGGLRKIQQVQLELSSVRTFNASKVSFREPYNMGFRWPVLSLIGAGELNQADAFVGVDGSNLRVWNAPMSPILRWPSGDPNPRRRWLLKLRITGLSKRWVIKLELQWTVGSKTIELTQSGRSAVVPGRVRVGPNVAGSGEQASEDRVKREANTGDTRPDPQSIPEVKTLNSREATKRPGRRSNPERGNAIRSALGKYGPGWRSNLSDIFKELDDKDVPLGDYQGYEIDLGDGQIERATKWGDLDLTTKNQRRRVIDFLRKYS